MRTIKKGDTVRVKLASGEEREMKAASDERQRMGMRSFDFIAYDGGCPPWPVLSAYVETPGVYPVRGGSMILETIEIK